MDDLRGYPFRGWISDRSAYRHHDGCGELRFADGPYLHHRLYAWRSRLSAFFQLHLAFHLLNADAGDVKQFPSAFLWLGSGRAGLLFTDRLLVYTPYGNLCKLDVV